MNITAIIYDADARRTAYILGTSAPRATGADTQTSSPSPQARTARS